MTNSPVEATAAQVSQTLAAEVKEVIARLTPPIRDMTYHTQAAISEGERQGGGNMIEDRIKAHHESVLAAKERLLVEVSVMSNDILGIFNTYLLNSIDAVAERDDLDVEATRDQLKDMIQGTEVPVNHRSA